MEIEGFTNYLIYEDGRVYSKQSNKFLTARKKIKNSKTHIIQLRKDGKSKDFTIEKLIGKYYPPQGGTPIKDFESYEIFPDGRIWSKQYYKFINIIKRKNATTSYVTLDNVKLSFEKLFGKHYPHKGGIIIEGFNSYEIFEDGRVWSKKCYRFVSQQTNTNGYVTCRIIRNDNISKTKSIHRLVAKAFIPNPNNLEFVDHKDRNKKNNNLNNLRWVTRRDNNCNTKIPSNNTSGIKGVFETRYGTWTARYNINHLQKSKTFNTQEEAIRFREEMVNLHYNLPK